ncbi:hypothetical protein ACPZ19_50535 [Amycolatopsis lurida]
MDAVMGYWQRRRERRLVALDTIARRIAHLPPLNVSAAEDDAAYHTILATLDALHDAYRLTRRGSPARLLLQDAHAWLTAWFEFWGESRRLDPHSELLYEQMTSHLSNVSARLSEVVEAEARRVGRSKASERWSPDT